MDPLLTLSATRLAELIRGRAVGAREVLEAHIRRAEEVNPGLNALVAARFAEARAEADAADARVRAGAPEELPPLHGVPCTIKECFPLSGMPCTSGLVSRRGVRSTRDATAVERLRSAGAIPLGVTNVSELCMWMETDNRVYGRTNNPYDRRRTIGGSSGGEGAMVGAGASPFGLGADIGGSIRMPAFFGGVFGHKPTGGLVPTTGHYPPAENDVRRYVTAGPLCRRAEDLMPLLRVLAGTDGEDEGCVARTLGDPAEVRLEELTVYDVEDNGALPVSAELKSAQRAAARHLAARGARVEPLRLEELRHSLDIWMATVDETNVTSFRARLGEGRPIPLARELARWALRRSPHTFPALGLALLEKLPRLMPARSRRMIERGRRLREELRSRLQGRGVLLFPPYPTAAPRHLVPLLYPFCWQYTAIFNVLEMPSTQVPLGLNRSGLPLGVQVAGAAGDDHLTVAVALELERAMGGWVPPLQEP